MTEERLTCGDCPVVRAENWERGMQCVVTGHSCEAEDKCICSSEDFDALIKLLREARERV